MCDYDGSEMTEWLQECREKREKEWKDEEERKKGMCTE